MIMKVAVPCPKHSPMLGHEASSHTVLSFAPRRIRLISWKRSPPPARARIHSGFLRGSAAITLIGMRAVFPARLASSLPSGVRVSAMDDQAAKTVARRVACQRCCTAAIVSRTPRSTSRVAASPG